MPVLRCPASRCASRADRGARGSRLTRSENLNLDVLFRYVLNPWSALYVGFNDNESNLELVDTPQGTQVVRGEDLARDGRQLFVKFSYLLQP